MKFPLGLIQCNFHFQLNVLRFVNLFGFQRTETRFFDTMSFHTAICGQTGMQKILHKASISNSWRKEIRAYKQRQRDFKMTVVRNLLQNSMICDTYLSSFLPPDNQGIYEGSPLQSVLGLSCYCPPCLIVCFHLNLYFSPMICNRNLQMENIFFFVIDAIVNKVKSFS